MTLSPASTQCVVFVEEQRASGVGGIPAGEDAGVPGGPGGPRCLPPAQPPLPETPRQESKSPGSDLCVLSS